MTRMAPLFQIALDCIDVQKVLGIAELVQDFVDIIEIGTVLLKKEGIGIIKDIKQRFPDKHVFVDTKTVDLGKLEARLMFDAGADLMSVCGLASDTTIELAIREAHAREKKIAIDLIGLGDSYRQVKRLAYLQPDYLTVHAGVDERAVANDLFEKVEIISQISPIPLTIAGGIQLDDIPYLLVFHPAIIIVGSAITNSADPVAMTKRFRDSMTMPSILNLESF